MPICQSIKNRKKKGLVPPTSFSVKWYECRNTFIFSNDISSPLRQTNKNWHCLGPLSPQRYFTYGLATTDNMFVFLVFLILGLLNLLLTLAPLKIAAQNLHLSQPANLPHLEAANKQSEIKHTVNKIITLLSCMWFEK